MKIFDNIRQLSLAIGSRILTAIAKSLAIDCVRLLTIAFAFSSFAYASINDVVSSSEVSSSAIRFEGRDTYAGALARGTVAIGEPDGASVTNWDSTLFADGWQGVTVGTNSAELAVLNNAKVAIEGGRLLSNTTWDASVTHLLRNIVYVPNGVTLTVTEGAVVKFCEGTFIKVEDGGKLNVVGASGNDVIFTAANDDGVGEAIVGVGDETIAFNGIRLQSSAAAFVDNGYVQILGFRFDVLPVVSLNNTEAFRDNGSAVIPVTLGGATRNTQFSIEWEAIDGTAKFGEDFTLAKGIVTWTKSTEGTKYITIPLNKNEIRGEVTQFKVRISICRACSSSVKECTVTVREFDKVDIIANSCDSGAIRFEGRDTYAGALARGTVAIGEPEGASVTNWDSTLFVDGWQGVTVGTNSAELAVLNNVKVAIEGGRLLSNTTWDASVTHLLRNVVYVPNGVTLTVTEGAVVKFCEGTFIKVEDGGKLNVVGASGNDVIFTAANDDGVGEAIAGVGDETIVFDGIRLQSSAATFTDNNYFQGRGFNYSALPTVVLNNTTTFAAGGVACIPVTLGGATREVPFSFDWVAETNGIAFATGSLNWAKSAEGTKNIVINFDEEFATATESFIIRIVTHRACNISRETCTVTMSEWITLPPESNEGSSSAIRFEGRDTYAGALARGTVVIGEPDGASVTNWDSTVFADGWQGVTVGTNSAELAVLNNAKVAIEGGRLFSNTTWDASVTHLLRNVVYVPNGVTLTVTEGAVVKFCEGTFIKVEDGGKLNVVGASGNDVIFTAANDDGVGEAIAGVGDETIAFDGIRLQSGSATFADNGYVQILGFRFDVLPVVSLNNTEAFRNNGFAVIPVTLGGATRNTQFSIEWEAIDGTAKFGEDFTLAKGIVTWTKSTEGTKYITIPLNKNEIRGEVTQFKVRISICRACSSSVKECTVTVREFDKVDIIANSCDSGAIRFEGRDTYAGALARGTVAIGEPDGASVTNWDSTVFADGWQGVTVGTNSAELAVLNNAKVAIEGGRLLSNTTWDASVTHLLRNVVYVPNGVTLTVTEGAVVKFCEGTFIKVEDGGKLNVVGASGNDVIFTAANDDGVGEAIAGVGDETIAFDGIRLQSSAATFTDNGYVQTRGFGFSSYPTVTLHNATAHRENGKIFIAATISGATRNQSFTIDWKTIDGTAKYGSDFTLGKGTITWSKSGDGTKWIEIPLNKETVAGESRQFKVMIETARGVNVATGTVTAQIDEYENCSFNGDEITTITSEYSDGAEIDDDGWRQPIFLNEIENVRYSGLWQNKLPANQTLVRLSVESNNGITTLAEYPGEEIGEYKLNVASFDQGYYKLKHEIIDESTKNVVGFKQRNFSIVDKENVVLHGGTLTGNEIWEAGKVHVVYQTVVVPSIYTLFIEPCAIVKFMSGTGIDISSGGAFFANNIIFTHINDDTIGGDTLSDGFTEPPIMDAYTLVPIGSFTFGPGSELRYITQPVDLSGTISGNKVLLGGSTYRVSGTVTIANGGVLTIPAGTILKMKEGASIVVNKGGTLDAQGTRVAPIFITSIKDDEYGGDTNGDGNRSIPQPGDWEKIGISGGNATFVNTHILYSSKNSTTGAINLNGGTVVFSNSEIAHGLYDAVGVESGHFYMTNSVIRDCLLAFRHWAKDPIVNSVIYDCGRLTQGGGQNFVNCIFSEITETWEAFGFPQNTTYKNCCFWNENGSVLTAEGNQDALTVCGKNGNVWGNPLFVDPDNGDFRIYELSACVDAADSSIAPEEDYYGQPRITLRDEEDGGGLGEEALADIGICEVMPRNVTSDIDLVPTGIQTLTNAVVGQVLYITWEVANRGGKFLEASWRDTVSLVSSMGQEVVLGDKITSSQISVDGSVFCSAYFVIPAIEEGVWYPRVNVNSTLDVFEGALGANNTLVGDTPIAVEIESIDLSMQQNYAIMAGMPKTMKLSFAEADKDRMVKFKLPNGVKVSWGFGFVPKSEYHSGTMVSQDGEAIFLVPDGDVDVYVVLESDENATFEIEMESTELVVAMVKPNNLPSSGTTTLTISGAGFGATNAVILSNASDSCRLQSVTIDNNGNLVATVDCEKLLASATYSLTVEANGKNATLDNAVTVSGAVGKGEFWANLIIPSSTRQGRDSICYIEYGNKGTADVSAQILQVTIDGDGTISSIGSNVKVDSIRFVACGEKPISGILSSGSTYRIPFILHSGSRNKVSLRIEGPDYKTPSYWATYSDYISEISNAATIIGRRGGDASDYNLVSKLAIDAQTNQQIVVYGVLKDKYSGKLLNNISVSLEDLNETNTVTVVSDKNGAYTIPIENNKQYKLSVVGYGDPSVDFTTIENTDLQFDLICDSKDSLHVFVFENDSKLFDKDLEVQVQNKDTLSTYHGVNTGDFYAFYGLPNGNYEIIASSGEKRGTSFVIIDDGIVGSMEYYIELLPCGGINGNVYGYSNYDDVLISVYGNGIEKSSLLNIDGTYSFDGLPIGEYRVSIFDLSLRKYSGEMSIVVESNDSKTVNFTSIDNLQVVSTLGLGSLEKSSVGYRTLMSSNNDVNIPWWRSVRSVAKDYYDEGFKLFTSVAAKNKPQPPQGEYDCACNRAKYNNDLATFNAFSKSLKDFISAYGKTDSMLFWAKASKAIGVGADAYGSYYSWVTRNVSFGKNVYEKLISEIAKGAILDGVGMINDGLLNDLEESGDLMDYITENIYKPVSGSVNLVELGQNLDMLDTYAKQISKGKRLYYKPSLLGKMSSGVSTIFGFIDSALGIKRTIEAGMDAGAELAKWSIGKEKMKALMPKFKRDISNFRKLSSFYNNYELCCSSLPMEEISDDMLCEFAPIVPRSSDPNEMAGPLGSGDPDTERFVTPGEWMTYTVYFENKSDATAAAQEVTVSNPLSKYLDWDTLEMLDVAFGNQIDVGLSGKSSGVSEIAMQGSSSLVRTEMTLDKTNGKVNWYLRIVDPTTDTSWPLDPVAGFLPPNDETHRGEGHITYRIKLRDDVPLGTKIDNSATIVFDYNEPIETDPAWWNIVGGNIADKSLEVSFAMNNGELNQDGNYIYDGTAKSPEVALKLKVGKEIKTLSQGKDFECTFFDNVNANSGTNHPRVAIKALGNYFGSVVTNFVIAPRPVSLVSATDTWVYDGKPHNNDTVTADGFIGSDGVVCSNFVSIVDVGAISNKFEYAFKSGVIESNYNIKSNYGTLTVTPANIADMEDGSKWAIRLEGDHAKYDGTEKTVTVSALSYDGVAIPNYTVTGNKATDAGVYTLTITANGNFAGSKTAKWSIGKRAVTLTSVSDSKVYDGTALKAESVTVGGDGFANGEGATYTFIGSQTDVGTSENTFAYRLNANTKAGNYDITTANGTLTVTTFATTDGSKWAVTLEGDNAKYDGTEKTVTVSALSYDGVAMPNYNVTGNKATDAGTYTLTITANGNFAGSKSVEWSIAKRAVTLTSASDSKVYDGTALKAESVTVGGDGFANGEGATYLFTTSQTDIGSCVNDFTYALNQDTKYENYDITTAFGTLTVIMPPTVELKIDLSKTVKGKGEWGNVRLLTNSIPITAAVAGTVTSYTINGGANVDLTFVPNEGFRIYGSQAGNGAFTSITNYTFVAMTNCTYSATFQPAPKTSLAWKYAKNKNGWFCAQISLPGYAGYSEAFENPRFLFADRVNIQNVRTSYLVDTSTVIDPLSTTEAYGNTTYRKVALPVSVFNGKVNGARVVFGVSDATMSSTVDSVLAGERTIALRVVNRNINSVELLDNVIGYFVWDCCGETYYQPLGGKQSPDVILTKPLSIRTLNNASAFGIDASAVAPEYVNCRFTSFNIVNGKFNGTFEVVAESDEGTKAAVKEISSSVDTSLLGSESPAGPFESIEDEVNDITFDVDNAPFTFKGTLPKKYKFFRLNLNIEELYK